MNLSQDSRAHRDAWEHYRTAINRIPTASGCARPAWKPAVPCLVLTCIPPIAGRGPTPRPLALVGDQRINLSRCRASGARAAERISCPSWTVAQAGRLGRDRKGRALPGGTSGVARLEAGVTVSTPSPSASRRGRSSRRWSSSTQSGIAGVLAFRKRLEVFPFPMMRAAE